MSKKFSKFFLVTLILFSTLSLWGRLALATGAPVFLNLGTENLEVKLFQTILNLDSATRVSVVGAGSSGRETEYFGSKTRLAVIKFQRKYKITGEMGRIGPKTRQLMAYLAPKLAGAKKNKGVIIPTDWPEEGAMTTATTAVVKYLPSVAKASSWRKPIVVPVAQKAVSPKIFSLTPLAVINGGVMTIHGEGFTKTGNTIKTKYQTYANVPSSDGQTLTFTFSISIGSEVLGIINSLPSGAASDISVPISVYVTNSNGKSSELTFNCQIR